MTSWPEPKIGGHLLPGLVAVALFAVMAFVFLQTPFAAADPTPGVDGFPDRTEVGNVSVAEDASIERRSDGIYAVTNGSETLVTRYTGANASIVTAGGDRRAVATIQTSVTESLGYAMFNLNPYEGEGHSRAGIDSEGFLVAFEIIDVVLVAALVAAVMLARREDGGIVRTALGFGGSDESVATDGGRETGTEGEGRTGTAGGSDDGGDR